MGPAYGKLPILFPYTIPIRIPKDMGIVWEAYHKQVPLLGVPEDPIDPFLSLIWSLFKSLRSMYKKTSSIFFGVQMERIWKRMFFY